MSTTNTFPIKWPVLEPEMDRETNLWLLRDSDNCKICGEMYLGEAQQIRSRLNQHAELLAALERLDESAGRYQADTTSKRYFADLMDAHDQARAAIAKARK